MLTLLQKGVVDYCNEGPRMAKYGSIGKSGQKNTKPNFGEHFNQLAKTLKVSQFLSRITFRQISDVLQECKSICKRVVTAEYIDQLIDDPTGSSKVSNVCGILEGILINNFHYSAFRRT
jgi:hypothetical protein